MIGRRREFRLYRDRRAGPGRVVGLLLIVLTLFVVHLLISSFLLRSVAVGSVSMEPTLSPKQRVFVTPLRHGASVPFLDRTLPAVRTPQRGDLVTVRPPYSAVTTVERLAEPFVSFFTLQQVRLADSSELSFEHSELLRRVIGVPGDTIRIEEFVAYVRPAEGDRFLEEHELASHQYTITFDPLPDGWTEALPVSGSLTEDIVLADDEYFVMSDNRSFTNDSRYWGPVAIERVTGAVLFRYWPFDAVGIPR